MTSAAAHRTADPRTGRSLELKDPALLRDRCFIGGDWVKADGGKRFDVRDPFNGDLVSTVPDVGRRQVQQAIEAAQAAWPAWRVLTGKQRAATLKKWADLMQENREDLARLLTAEQGKPLKEARGEIDYAASFLEWFSEEAKRVYGDTIPAPHAGQRIVVIKQPIGVCAAITPWNFPSAMITRKAGAALAGGSPMVVKPAEQTPLSALALAVLAERAGVPAGIFSVVTSSDPKEVGAELTGNPIVRKLSFTGSTEVGKILMRQCSDTVKRVSLELGGNAPFIVFDDADLDAAVEGLMASKFRNAGQTCVCANRVYVQSSVYADFAGRLAKRVRELRVGAGTDPDVDQGPLIDEAAVAKVEAHLGDAQAKGATIATGGKRHALGGTFFEPTILTGATDEMLVSSEETFGPVAPLFSFEDEAEVIGRANATPFGLCGYFYGRDIGRVWRVAEALESGIVGVNTGIISTDVAPFGGVKESGLGREGSKYGVEDYLEVKYICLAGIGN
ncbi:NAD-dependent succinate-semialdehyde dehydrogenase [Mesorhizobium sp. SP-1A]|uniref:NAD-dependent succinate-semialdehyde dehydrogenase n=1 Tax=Mesorhizobium sp. SP-1A TaxID=3077840 RepID=UPI0028F6DE48|nr:NAD-dependent succinate-semialdehyde dehydrogenase [Mesorhizobium sp. SP-1A]